MNWRNFMGVLALVGLMALVGFRLKSNKDLVQEKVYQYDKDKPLLVQVDTIHLMGSLSRKTFSGTFEPHRESKISAAIQGEIISVLAYEGDFVQKDQKLVLLDQSLLKINLQEADLKIKELRNDVNRYMILTEAEAVQGLQLEKTKIGLETAEIKKSALLEQINKTEIKAPFSGVVTAKFTEVGGFAAPGMPLLQITDIGRLRFTIQVPEKDLKMFHLHQEMELTADAYPEIPLTGKVIMIGSKANMAGRFPVQFQVSNTKSMDIKAGMFGKAEADFSDAESQITIPGSALIREDGGTLVYLVKDQKAVLQPVKLLRNTGGKVIVSEGLKPGDVLITKGFINLFDGATVRVGNEKLESIK